MYTEEQRNSFHEAAKPLIKWLCDNCHPHVTVLVSPTNAELTESVLNIVDETFVKD